MVPKTKEKLKILCLHGYRQTSTTFYEKTGAFRKMVGNLCDLVIIDAPHLVPGEAHGYDGNDEQRGWWFSQPHGYFKVIRFKIICRKKITRPSRFINLQSFSYIALLFADLPHIFIKFYFPESA